MLETERHRQTLAEGKEDDFETTWGLLFDTGGDARVYGIAFDESRTAPWKEGWIDADINLGCGDCEQTHAVRSLLPMRANGCAGARVVRTLLHAAEAGRRILRRSA